MSGSEKSSSLTHAHNTLQKICSVAHFFLGPEFITSFISQFRISQSVLKMMSFDLLSTRGLCVLSLSALSLDLPFGHKYLYNRLCASTRRYGWYFHRTSLMVFGSSPFDLWQLVFDFNIKHMLEENHRGLFGELVKHPT